MIKKNKFLTLCALLIAGTVSLTACGNTGNNNTEAPYEDETNKDVNDKNNTNNATPGGDLEDAGRNLMDSIKDTGDAIRDGIDDLGDDNNNTNNNQNNQDNMNDNNNHNDNNRTNP